eukprot:TRINITY_DN112395_c0_g1_i1.p1 TRINITY_DN112395_c0_g1~~TRINITY_DN112395_c0_g1_i1.p1  ORF type:complete len:370 (+),score=72.55 TRINITY_DN112395_c0_g1_i1:50-1159(+)
MASGAHIGHILDPLIDPSYWDQDAKTEKAFGASGGNEEVQRDYVSGFQRSSLYAMDWAGDKLLVATKDSPGIRLQDVEKGEEDRTWQGEWMSLRCDPNNPHIAAAVSWSGKFKVFDTRSASQNIFDVDLKKTSNSMKEFLVLCWSPDSRHIALNNRSDQVYLLNLRSAKGDSCLRLGSSKNMSTEVSQMVYSQDGDSLWVGTGGTPGKIHVFPSQSLQSEYATSVAAHQHATISLAADPKGNYIASGGADCMVTLWDPKHLICVRTFGYAVQSVTNLDFNFNGSLLAWGTGTGEKNLTIVGSHTGSLYWQDQTAAPVSQVKWHPKRNVLAYGLNTHHLPDERDYRDRRGGSGRERDNAVIHTLKIPDNL